MFIIRLLDGEEVHAAATIDRLTAVLNEPHPAGSAAGDAKTRARLAAKVSGWVDTLTGRVDTLKGLDTLTGNPPVER